MLEKFGNLAENVATNVGMSRRGFLGWASRGALAVAGALAAASIAKAGRRTKSCCDPGGKCPTGTYCYHCTCVRGTR